MKWCQRPGLNRRPKAYESSALPLSYSGKIDQSGEERGLNTGVKTAGEGDFGEIPN